MNEREQRAIADSVLVESVVVGRSGAEVVLVFELPWDAIGERRSGEPLVFVAAFGKEEGYGAGIHDALFAAMRDAMGAGGGREPSDGNNGWFQPVTGSADGGARQGERSALSSSGSEGRPAGEEVQDGGTTGEAADLHREHEGP